jgi:hypothetical protein
MQTLLLTLVECAIPLIVLYGLHRVAVRVLPTPRIVPDGSSDGRRE